MSKPRMKIQSGQNLNTSVKSSEVFTLDRVARNFSAPFSQRGALQIATFYSCVKDKAEAIGQLPLRMYRTSRDGSKTEVQSGREHRIYTKKPNDYMTMSELLEMMVVSLETNGAFYAYKERNDRGNTMAIIPFRYQDNIHPSMDTYGNVYYTYTTNDGMIRDPYNTEDLVIIKNMTIDGYTPIRPISYMATTLGIADSQDKSYKELQENGITSQMALQTDGIFTDPKAIERLKADWGEYRGPNGPTRIPILEQGLKPVSLKLTPQEAELLQHKAFTEKVICAMTGVYKHRINPETMTIGVIHELDEAYFSNKLNPVMKKFEQAWSALLPDDLEVKFNRKAFYDGSPWRLVQHVEREVKGGLATVNEGRLDLGRERVEGADVFAIDNNNVTYGTWPELPSIQEQIYNRAAGNSGGNNTEDNTDEN